MIPYNHNAVRVIKILLVHLLIRNEILIFHSP